jgi:hypothetical protein
MASHARHMLGVLTIANNASQRRWFVRVLPAYRVFVIIAYLGTLALAGYGLYLVVQTGDWEHLWKEVDFRLVLLVPLAFSLDNQFGRGSSGELVSALAAIRDAAARGDERIAPLAADQPPPLQQTMGMNGSAVIGPLHGPSDTLYARPTWTLVGVLMGVMAIVVLGAAVAIFWFDAVGWTTPIISDDPTTDAIIRAIFGCFGVVMLGAAVACVWLVARLLGMQRRGKLGMTLAADERGVAWTDPGTGKRRYLAWTEAQLFFLVADDGSARIPPARFHVLLGPGLPLTWTTPSPVDGDQWAAHTRLCRLIVTAAHLPLRDLSAVSERLSRVARGSGARKDESLTEVEDQEASLAMPGIGFERIRTQARRQTRLVLALEAPYVLLFIVGIVGSVLQHFGIG